MKAFQVIGSRRAHDHRITINRNRITIVRNHLITTAWNPYRLQD
jgi:hypothetical protein